MCFLTPPLRVSSPDTLFPLQLLPKYFQRNQLRCGCCWADTKYGFSEVTEERQRPSICLFKWLNQVRDVWGYTERARQDKVFLRTTEAYLSTGMSSCNMHVPSTVCSLLPGPCPHRGTSWFDCVHSETWSHFKDRGGRALKLGKNTTQSRTNCSPSLSNSLDARTAI